MPLLVRSDDAEHQAQHLHRPDKEKQWKMTWNTAYLKCKQKFTTTMDVPNVIPFIGIGELYSALFRNLNLN